MPKKEKVKAVVTPMFRCSFVDIVEKNTMSDKYKITMMFDKDTDIMEIKKMAKAARMAKWPNALPKGFQNPFKIVDNMDEDEKYDGYEPGMIVLSAISASRPGVVNKKKQQIDVEELDSHLYSGCYARASITAFPYDTKGNKGVSFGVNAIMVVKDGDPLGSKMNPEAAFADVEDYEGDDDFETGTEGEDTSGVGDFDL